MANSKVIKIDTPFAPKAIGPYSQATRAGEFVFVSGQLPLYPQTGKLIEGDVRAKTERVFDNIEAILEAAGSSLQQVVRVEVFLKDLNDFAAVNEVYGNRFKQNSVMPARQTIQVAKLPLDAAIEISCVAYG